MKNKERFFSIMHELYTFAPAIAMSCYVNEYVNTGLMLQLDINNIIASGDLLNYQNDITTLVRMYAPFSDKTVKINNSFVTFPNKYEFFTTSEIAEASFNNKSMQNALPVKLDVLAELRPQNFITALSIREIMMIKTAGLIQWKSEMQREQVTDGSIDGKLISHIKFDPERSKQIGDSIAEGTFYPNALRWHVIASDSEYHYEDDKKVFVLDSGYFAEIDGQHRNKAIEYALNDNPSINIKFPIIVSIGGVKIAQHIINQDEKRAPISRDRVIAYSNTFGRAVVDEIIKMNELNEEANFISNPVEDVDNIKSVMISAINEYYFSKITTPVIVHLVALWITDFINNEYNIRGVYELNLRNKPVEMKFRTPYIRAYICLSSLWKDELLNNSLDDEEALEEAKEMFLSLYKYPKSTIQLCDQKLMRNYAARFIGK